VSPPPNKRGDKSCFNPVCDRRFGESERAIKNIENVLFGAGGAKSLDTRSTVVEERLETIQETLKAIEQNTNHHRRDSARVRVALIAGVFGLLTSLVTGLAVVISAWFGAGVHAAERSAPDVGRAGQAAEADTGAANAGRPEGGAP
jgi:hypothetical protein